MGKKSCVIFDWTRKGLLDYHEKGNIPLARNKCTPVVCLVRFGIKMLDKTGDQMSFKDANNRIHLDRVWLMVLTILYAKLTFCSFKRISQKFFTIMQVWYSRWSKGHH